METVSAFFEFLSGFSWLTKSLLFAALLLSVWSMTQEYGRRLTSPTSNTDAPAVYTATFVQKGCSYFVTPQGNKRPSQEFEVLDVRTVGNETWFQIGIFHSVGAELQQHHYLFTGWTKALPSDKTIVRGDLQSKLPTTSLSD